MWLGHRESFRLSISNLAYSEPGSPFQDCREGLTDHLSSSVLLLGIEPRTGRKRDAAITIELIPAPCHRERRGNQRNACSCLFSKPFSNRPFSNRPHTQKGDFHRSPSVTSNACVTSNGYLSAAPALAFSLNLFLIVVKGDLRSTARKCAWVRTR